MRNGISLFRVVSAGFSAILFAVPAQAAFITVAPLGQPAPALSTWMLGLLTVSLAVLAVRKLRGGSTTASAVVAGLAVIATLATVSSAGNSNIVVTGDDCLQRTTYEYDGGGSYILLTSQCAAPIVVTATDAECYNKTLPEAAPSTLYKPCVEGLVLETNKSCRPPLCD